MVVAGEHMAGAEPDVPERPAGDQRLPLGLGNPVGERDGNPAKGEEKRSNLDAPSHSQSLLKRYTFPGSER